MPNPIDMLIGPALRRPQPPREGEVPGSRQPYSPIAAAAGAAVALLAAGWAIRRLGRGATSG